MAPSYTYEERVVTTVFRHRFRKVLATRNDPVVASVRREVGAQDNHEAACACECVRVFVFVFMFVCERKGKGRGDTT